MPTDKKQMSIGLSEEDYQWIEEKAELTGNSQAGVLRQIVRGVRLGKPGLLYFGSDEMVFADETGSSETDGSEQSDDEAIKRGLEAFKTN